MVIDTLNRRSFLTAAAGFALPFARYHHTHEKQPFLFVSSLKQADGNHAVVAVDEGGAIKFQEILRAGVMTQQSALTEKLGLCSHVVQAALP
tara:strand:- start:992 stop:1267 length:276 start_codon:yes stop_codon:yes gene_type:complete